MSEAGNQQSSKPPSGPSWIEWGQKLQAIAQSGLTFATDPFDIERYESIREIASEIIATGSQINPETVQDLLRTTKRIRHAKGRCPRRSL